LRGQPLRGRAHSTKKPPCRSCPAQKS
jgi:hypothetical protein